MPVLDFEAIRHRVKLVEDSGDTRIFENRDEVACPTCGEPFEEALVTEATSRQLQSLPNHRVCLVRGDAQLFIFTHAV